MAEKLLKIKYPKFLLLLLTFVIAYLLFYNRAYGPFHDFVASLSYFGTFISGSLYVYGFTAAPATALLLILAKEQNILLASLVGGLGALIGDLIIFSTIRHSFADEIEKLFEEEIVKYIHSKTPPFIKKYFIPAAAIFIIASPLPDEVGIALFAATRNISLRTFSVFSYLINTIGIFVVLYIGRVI